MKNRVRRLLKRWSIHANLLKDATRSSTGYGVRPNFSKTFRADSVEETLFRNDHLFSRCRNGCKARKVKRGLMSSSLSPEDGVGAVAFLNGIVMIITPIRETRIQGC